MIFALNHNVGRRRLLLVLKRILVYDMVLIRFKFVCLPGIEVEIWGGEEKPCSRHSIYLQHTGR